MDGDTARIAPDTDGRSEAEPPKVKPPKEIPPQAKPPQEKKPPPQDQTQSEDPPPGKRRILPFILFGVVLVALAIGGGSYWMHARHFESTDDAFIDGHISELSSQVAGRIARVAVDDNQLVRAGEVLVEIDPADYRLRLAQADAQRGQAQAQLAQAQAQMTLQGANLGQAEAQVRAAQADLFQAQQDSDRFHKVDQRAISRQQVDNASASLRSAQAKLDVATQAVAGGRAQVLAAAAAADAARASLHEAEVAVDTAKQQLSYATITAPVDGWVARRRAQIGDYVTPGQALLAVVPRAMYVTANFKETQLADMRAGQPVDVSVDAYPSVTFRGRIDSFQQGTGSAFATLPAENATGNYVKVVQRVPVKIVFDDDRAASFTLAPGMSVNPRVTVR